MIQVVSLDRTEETAVTDCPLSKIEFPRCRGRRVEADFGGGDVWSNGGVVLIAAADRSWAWAAHVSMVEAFIASFAAAPDELVLDFDATGPRA